MFFLCKGWSQVETVLCLKRTMVFLSNREELSFYDFLLGNRGIWRPADIIVLLSQRTFRQCTAGARVRMRSCTWSLSAPSDGLWPHAQHRAFRVAIGSPLQLGQRTMDPFRSPCYPLYRRVGRASPSSALIGNLEQTLRLCFRHDLLFCPRGRRHTRQRKVLSETKECVRMC